MTESHAEFVGTRNDNGAQLAGPADAARAGAIALAEAQVKARYAMALQRPRNLDDVRTALVRDCKRPRFAQSARYLLPIGEGVEGWSIRFAESAIRSMGNIEATSKTVLDDAERRTLRIEVIDFETNASFSKDVTIEKVVERHKLRQGQHAIGVRKNDRGQQVFLVAASERDLEMKEGAAISRVFRTQGLRHLPAWILDECLEIVTKVREDETAKDPDAERRALVDGFARLGVKASDIADALGHGLDGASPRELVELRAVFETIRDGASTWRDYATMKGATPAKQGEDDPHAKTRESVQAAMKRQADKAQKKAKTKADKADQPPAESGPGQTDGERQREPGED